MFCTRFLLPPPINVPQWQLKNLLLTIVYPLICDIELNFEMMKKTLYIIVFKCYISVVLRGFIQSLWFYHDLLNQISFVWLSIMKVVNQNPVRALYLISPIGFNDCKLFRYSPPNRIEEGWVVKWMQIKQTQNISLFHYDLMLA